METKAELRGRVKALLSAQTPEERRRRSLSIESRLFASKEFSGASNVAFFASLTEEVETRPMIERALREGKNVALPKTDLTTKKLSFYRIEDARELTPGTMGIPEPREDASRLVAPEDLDCVVVPGVVFDRAGYRIGHGAGLYDRFLKIAPGVKIGLAYSFQLVGRVPVEPHDVRVDRVITD